jgi:hypothetical protein
MNCGPTQCVIARSIVSLASLDAQSRQVSAESVSEGVMKVKQWIATSMLALSGAMAAQAQEAAPDAWIDVPSVRTREQVRAQAAEARRAHVLTFGEHGRHEPPFTSGLKRSEVLADLQLWRESGLEALSRGEGGADITSERYRHAAGKYEALRSSLHYGDVVRQIAHRIGESFVAGPTRC